MWSCVSWKERILLEDQVALFAMYLIGVVAFGLLLIGIHSAWDSVIDIVVTGSNDGATKTE